MLTNTEMGKPPRRRANAMTREEYYRVEAAKKYWAARRKRMNSS